MLKAMVEEAHIVIRLTAISAEQEPHSTIAAFLINLRATATGCTPGICASTISRVVGSHRTSDHSYVQALVDRGELTEAESQQPSAFKHSGRVPGY